LADDLQLARAVRDAALATQGVYTMGAGRYAEAATYGVGEKVSGVVVTDDEVRAHIVVGYPLGKSIPGVTRTLLERIAPLARGRRPFVVVEDLEVVADEDL
jgi:hypothetical protein